MAEDEKDSRWGWLLTAGKVVGAIATIGGVTIAVCGWLFSVAMTDRDNKIQDLQADIDALNQSIAHLSSQLDDSEERFTNLRIAMELLNARLELRTAEDGPAAPVRVRVRPHAASPIVPTVAAAGGDHHVDAALPPPMGRRFPPPPEERVFHTDSEAAAAFDQALEDVGGPP
jgi:hypothetical protein